MPLDGGASSFVAIQQGAPARLAIVGSALYWTKVNTGDGTVLKVAK